MQPTAARDQTPASLAPIPAENSDMPDKFDPYREALVMETTTIWPEEYETLEARQREKIALALHEDPASASHLEYVRTHSGFCRQITVTSADVERLAG